MPIEEIKYNYHRRFGFELEFSSGIDLNQMTRVVNSIEGERVARDYRDYRGWQCKYDCSCGVELASRIMRNHQGLKKAAMVTKALEEEGARTGQSCGFHVHVDVSDLSREQKDAILAWWIKIEGFVMNSVPDHRKNNRWSQLLSTHFAADTSYSGSEIRSMMPSTRYCSLNTWSDEVRGSFEFRIAEGTIKSNVVKNWIRFLVHFVEMVKDKEMPENLNWLLPEEILKLLKLVNDPTTGTQRVYSSSMQEMRKWILERIKRYASDPADKQMACRILETIS